MFYIVHVAIRSERAAEWRAWMTGHHIPEVVATGAFHRAWLLRDDAADTDTHTAFRSVYECVSAEALEAYRREHAPALQADHAARFDGDFIARRELLPVLHTFTHPAPGA